jgi:hypothetical protein
VLEESVNIPTAGQLAMDETLLEGISLVL